MIDDEARRLLILGGTAEAAQLARASTERFGDRLHVTTALAGRTERPGPLAGDVRIGGFGGADGLANYLIEAGIDILIDATHPFAEQISRHARLAGERVGLPRLILSRPPWRRHPMDRWIEVEDLAGAATAIGRISRRCFLTVGTRDLDTFASLRDVHFVVRLIDPPKGPLPLASYEIVLGRGPFALAEERTLLREHSIDVVAAKASGGDGAAAKLAAAREASLPVVLVRRPKPEPGPRVEDVEAALAWLDVRLAGATATRARAALP